MNEYLGIEGICFDELCRNIELQEKELQKLCHVEDDCIVLDSGDYFVELDRCNSMEKIVRWCMHLLGKEWFDRKTCRQFIRVACQAHGLDPYGV